MAEESGTITAKEFMNFVNTQILRFDGRLESICLSVEQLGKRVFIYDENSKHCKEKFAETDEKLANDLVHFKENDKRLIAVEDILKIGKGVKEESRNYIVWIVGIASFVILVFNVFNTVWSAAHQKEYLTKNDLSAILKNREEGK